MSLSKLKKVELLALAEENDVDVDGDWTKSDLVEALEEAGVGENNAPQPETKAERRARLVKKHATE